MVTGQLIKTRRPVIAIVGPTAIGKSRIGIQIAKQLQTEILTADSRQVFRDMDIGTDKPSFSERQGVPHRLIDLVNPDQPFNTGDFRQAAIPEIARLHQSGKIPLVIGGTGLYIRTLLRGLCPGPPADWALRKQMAEDVRHHGPQYLFNQLQRVDPALAQRLHPNDQPKIQRALEVFTILGKPFSHIQAEHRFTDAPYPYLLIGLTMNRSTLYERIDTRVEWEITKGLIQETQQLLNRGYTRELGSMKGLGYKQFSGYLAGEYSYEEAVRILKRDTRRFAKRQMTWFAKEPGIQWLSIAPSDVPDRAAALVIDRIIDFCLSLEMDPLNTIRLPEKSHKTNHSW
ncbi:MAG: tRNA (adenosine(37)-N6)-dimethylallyltransferase MiaA [Nitrospirales bacterium]|nr:tRNA (adenosine(37)-N6)-dimethylallyltransferase MiaA [Nitrospirales bacterium]